MTQKKDLCPEEISESWLGKFFFRKGQERTETTPEIKGLRSPQIGALHAILAHKESYQNEIGIIVMPTGTGKTETMLSFLVANQCTRTLVVVPSDALRTQISNKYKTLGLLKEIGVVASDAELPKVIKIKGKKTQAEWEKIVSDNNVIVTTMASVAELEAPVMRTLVRNMDYLIVDEAHHSQANTWQKFISHFPKGKTFLFTATPYRNDGKRLEGRIVFNYPLRKAQEDGYYKPIRFLPIMKYNREDGDMAIAEKAVAILKEDLANGYNHILMARCKDHKRAKEVFEIYKKYEDLNPVLVHSKVTNNKEIVEEIKSLKHKIVVCVNMLGEGYDLPNLKIAAMHDERQSLPITLQFIGRFTRTSKNLGQASFVTNMAYAPIREELHQLYQQDADWNKLLPRISDDKTIEEQNINEFMMKFTGSLKEEISINDIRPALSADVFTCRTSTTYFNNWQENFPSISRYKYRKWASTDNMLVIVLGKQASVDWGTSPNVENLTWELVVVYFDALKKRIFLNSTMDIKGERFLEAIFGPVSKVYGDKVFRIFTDVHRLFLTNVGTRRPQGKDISFQSFFGSSVQDGLDSLISGKLAKNNVFGIGYRDGKKISIGCSLKGKIWSRERTNLYLFQEWCKEMGDLITNEAIDTNTVLQNTLKITRITKYPSCKPIGFDWPDDVYEHSVLHIRNGKSYVPFEDFSITVDLDNSDDQTVYVVFESEEMSFKVGCSLNDYGTFYEILSSTDKPISFHSGRTEETINDYFNEFSPRVLFADGSVVYGNHIVESRVDTPKFDISKLNAINWGTTDLRKESRVTNEGTIRSDSIQYVFAEMIKNDFKVLIDDDGAGEVADLIGFNDDETGIDITLFHLKYAKDGKASGDINNLYQVCGQANKSIRWKYSHSRKLFDRILKRNERKETKGHPSSIISGAIEDLVRYREQALNSKALRFHVAIVQPGLSKAKCSEEIQIVLGNVQQFLKEVSAIDLKVYCSE